MPMLCVKTTKYLWVEINTVSEIYIYILSGLFEVVYAVIVKYLYAEITVSAINSLNSTYGIRYTSKVNI